MGQRLFADSAAASGVRWLLVSLVLAAVGDLVLDVPYYFGTVIPGLSALSGADSYRLYTSVLSVALPAVLGTTGFVGILPTAPGPAWNPQWHEDRASAALPVALPSSAFLFRCGVGLPLSRDPL